MPDLSLEASRTFWSEYHDPMVYRSIASMESIEDWTVDGDEELELLMQELGQELDNIGSLSLSDLEHEPEFFTLGCSLKISRVLKLLQSIDTVHPGSASKVLKKAESVSQSASDHAGRFLRRNIIFERLRLLARIFSKERLEVILSSIGGD